MVQKLSALPTQTPTVCLPTTMPCKLAIWRRVFEDPNRPEDTVIDAVAKFPEIGPVVLGQGLIVDECIPGTLVPVEGDHGHQPKHAGMHFGAAVLSALPREWLQRYLQPLGQVVNESEVMSPLMRRAHRGEVVIAGVVAPPAPAPRWVEFHPLLLHHWQFIPGSDEAVPIFPAIERYLALRVFTPIEWAVVKAADGRLPLASSGPVDALPSVEVLT